MGTLLSLMLSTFSANNRFAERAITDTRLRMENQSAIGKVLGLYQSDPRHPQLGPLNTARRAVSYLPYIAKHEGYLAKNKAVVINIDGRDYPDRNLIPTSITVRNMPDSQGALSVIGRTIRTDTNFIESASTVQIAKPASSAAPPNETVLNLPADLTNGEQRFVRRYEIVLFSDTDVLYEAVPNGSTQFVGDRINIAVTSRNASILGANQIASSNSASYAIRPPSVILASPDSLRNGSSGTAVLSSWNYPGVSTAFIDTFDAASANDWTTSGSITYPNGTALLTTGASLTYANATTAGDFDIRATFTGVVPPATPGGVLQATIGGTTYKIAIANVTSYQGNSTTCTTSTGSGLLSYVAYPGASAPADVGDGSSACISSHPNQYFPFAANTASSAYTLRFERRGSILNAFFCEATGTKDCERADQFTVINATPFCTNGGVSPNCNPGSVPATLAITATSSTALQYARVSQIGATAKTYTNTITLEKAVKIKQVELLGYVPPNAGLVVTTTPNLCSPATDCGTQTRIIPTTTTSTSSLAITLSFASASGDLSEIPFIYGIRVSYE